ncbi:MAG TPA: hypothetical protein VFF56_03010 [Bacillota bacterium]|nr:hypothetical protein [Bacillota bacterium]
MANINSKAKGKTGELEFANLCKKYGFHQARRSQQYAGINNDADVVGLPGIHAEVKRVEKLNVSKAMEQAIRDCGEGDIPIVAHRKNYEPWLITMLAKDWFGLYGAWQEGAKKE